VVILRGRLVHIVGVCNLQRVQGYLSYERGTPIQHLPRIFCIGLNQDRYLSYLPSGRYEFESLARRTRDPEIDGMVLA